MTAAPLASPRYEVLGHLATGGMGEIFLARRLGPAGFEKLVVLKRPLATAPGSRRLAAALIAEARLLARISHPNVCQIHDLEEAEGEYFLALELLEGLSLWSLLAHAERADRPIDPRVICGLFVQVCEGLAAIHELRTPDGAPAAVVHRDISPGNLFVTEAGVVKILDLGIAKHADSEDLTPFGNIKGKLPYLAPEQAAGKSVDARADLFALGLVLYDVSRARRPPSDRIGAVAIDELELNDLPPPLAAVIGQAVQRDPAARFPSAAAMALAIGRAGAALGGAADRAELAAWLRREHADALDEQRARLRAARKGARTRALTLRSAIHDTELDRPPEEAPDLLSHRTERLPPDDDHDADPRRKAKPAEMQAPPTEAAPTPRRRSRLLIGAALSSAALAGIIIAVVALRLGASPSRSPSPKEPAVAKAAAEEAAFEEVAAIEEADAAAAAAPPALPSPPIAEQLQPQPQQRRPSPSRTSRTTRPARPARTTGDPGLLTVGSMPWADIRINGRTLRTDVWRLELPPGRHVLHARTGDGREQNRAFQIEPGKETRIVLDWSRR